MNRQTRIMAGKPLESVLCGLLAALLCAQAVRAEEKVLLTTSFEDGKEAPDGWKPAGAAVWATFARTGTRSLEIRTWLPDPAMAQLNAEQAKTPLPVEEYRKKAQVEPEKTSWQSEPLAFSGQPVKLSFWRASHVTWANDESFRAEAGIQPCDKDGNPAGGVLSDIPMHFYELDRTSYQMVSLAVPDGLIWEYREAVLSPPKGSGRIVFHFCKFPAGQAWIDDLVVSESPDYAARTPVQAAAVKARTPWRMEINFPVSFNLFRLGDPLECDVALLGDDGPPGVKAGMKLAFEVRDFNYCYVLGGTVDLKDEQILLYRNDETHKARLVTLTLHKALEDYERRVLFIHAKLLDGKTLMAEDEVAFGIVQPVEAKAENLWRGCKVVPNWQPGPDLTHDFGDPKAPFNGHAHKLGAQWNAAPLGDMDYLKALGLLPYEWKWSDHLKKPEDAVEFPPTDLVFPNYGVHIEGYVLQVYKKGLDPYKSTPDWARESAKAKYGDKYGFPAFDVDGYAKFVAARVKRLHQVFPNAAVYCPTAGEVAHDQFRYDLQKAAYKAAKDAAPDVRIGTWVWGKTMDELPEDIRSSFDIIDTELYGDPQVGIGKDLGDLTKRMGTRDGKPVLAMAMEGCAKTGSERQIDSAKGVFDFHAHAWMNGVSHLGQYEFSTAHTAADGGPVLRGDLVNIYSGTGHSGGAKRLRMTRYDTKDTRLHAGVVSPPDYPATHYQPALPTIAFGNVIRWMDSCEPQRALHVPDIWAFVYKRLDQGLLFIETMRDWGERQVELANVPSGFVAVDIYGNRYRVEPKGGKCLLTVSVEPLILTFDKPLEAGFAVQPAPDVEVKMLVPIVRKMPGAVSVSLGKDRAGTLAIDVDPRLQAPAQAQVGKGETARMDITPLEERPTGKYRTYIRIMEGASAVGLLSLPLVFESSAITARCVGLPMTAKSDPAVRVLLKNGAESEQAMQVRFQDVWTTSAMRPEFAEREVKLGPLAAVSVDFPVERARARLNQDYMASVQVITGDGAAKTCANKVHFRAVTRAAKPLKVDADLSDWDLESLLPLEPNWIWEMRAHTNSVASKAYNWTWAQQNDPEGRFKMYLRWLDGSLYLSAVLRNSQHDHQKVAKDKSELWAQDCLYVVLYPAEFIPGEGTATFPYKMHLGLDENAKPLLQNGIGEVYEKPEAVDCEYAIKKTPEGYVYEFRMGPKYPGFRGLKVTPGARFSLSTMAWRRGGSRCYAFFRHFASFEGSINDMAQFLVVEE